MRVIQCARCGEDVFPTGPRTKYCLACATKIRIENQSKRRSGGLKNGAQHTKHITCEICGKDVVVSTKAARARYCPECAAKALRASTKKHRDKEKRWLLAEPRIITCACCGCEVVLENARSYNRKYCDDCRKIVYAELNRKAKDAYKIRHRTDGLHGDQKRCACCGVVFEKQGNQKYCDDCRTAAKCEQLAAKRRKRREGWRIGELPKKEKPRVSRIEDLIEAARKAGMSYGKYQAMRFMKEHEDYETGKRHERDGLDGGKDRTVLRR